MPEENEDLHGNAPDTSPAALLIIDMINDLEFPGGEDLREPARAAAERIAALKRRCRAAGIPTIYVNDNFGRWRSDFREVVQHVLEDGVPGEPLARALLPDEDDYFVLKPKHSGFYSTTLETLLAYLGTRQLILTGVQADTCVLLTAGDAYMRDLKLMVPEECVASEREGHTTEALAYIRRALAADTRPSAEIDLGRLIAPGRHGEEAGDESR